MAIKSRVTLKSVFEDGDTLEGANMSDFVDSYLHLSDTSAQTIISPTTFTGSATFENINMADLDVSALNAANISTGSIETSALRVTTSLSAQAVTIEGILSAASISVDKLEVSGSANFKDLQVSGINAALIECGRIQVSGVSAFSVWADNAQIVSAAILSGNSTFHTVSALTVYAMDWNVVVTADASAGNNSQSVVPATAAGYLVVNIGGIDRRIPFFEAAE